MPDDFTVNNQYMQVEWRPRRTAWAIRRAIADAVTEELKPMVRASRKIISRPGPPASRPGRPPKRRTGTLMRSVYAKLDRRTLKGGVGLKPEGFYGFYLETGTRRIAPRPWLSVVWNNMSKSTLARINKRASEILGNG